MNIVLQVWLFLFLNGGFIIMSDNNVFLTVAELAKVLKVHKSWVYTRTRETGPGSIPRINLGKYRRFILQDVLDWLKNKENVSI